MTTTTTTSPTSAATQNINAPLIVPIQCPKEPPEWSMIELNGEIIMPSGMLDGGDDENNSQRQVLVGKDQTELGSLRFHKDGTPIMVLGSHELKGNVVTLKEPFVVFKRQKCDDESTAYEVVAVVTKKLLFDQYPKSIMR